MRFWNRLTDPKDNIVRIRSATKLGATILSDSFGQRPLFSRADEDNTRSLAELPLESTLDSLLPTDKSAGNSTSSLEVIEILPAVIFDNQVTNAKLANMAPATLKGNPEFTEGDPQDILRDDLTTETNPEVGDMLMGWLKDPTAPVDPGAAMFMRKFDARQVGVSFNTILCTDSSDVQVGTIPVAGSAGNGHTELTLKAGSTRITISGNVSTDVVTFNVDGDVAGPSSATDNAIARFDGTTGKLIQDSNILVGDDDIVTFPSGGGINFANTFTLQQQSDNTAAETIVFDSAGAAELTSSSITQHFLSIKPEIAQSSTAEYTVLEIDVTETSTGSGEDHLLDLKVGGVRKFTVESNGATHIVHTASGADEHSLEIDVIAGGSGDVKAIDIDYRTGAISSGEEEAIILINIDESLANGGDVSAIEILATEGGVDHTHALFVGGTVAPIEQLSGTFDNADSILNKAVDVLTALSTGGAGNISAFVADNDTMTFGNTAKFEELEFILDTAASGAGIAPTWEYSTGAGPAYTAFTPIDGTNGLRNTGVAAWLDDDLSGWVQVGGEFLIRMTRTRNSLSTTPILDKVQVLVGTVFSWDKDGDLVVNSVTAGTLTASGNIVLTNAVPLILDASGNELLGFSPTASAVTFLAFKPQITGVNPQLGGFGEANTGINLVSLGSGVVEVNGVEVVTISGTQSLTNKTLVTPTVVSLANMTHDHNDAAGGGPLAAKHITETKKIYIESPAATDVFSMVRIPYAATITKITGETDSTGSNATVDFDIETRATAKASGTAVNGGAIVAADTELVDTSFAGDAGITADDYLFYVASAIANTPTDLWVSVTYTINA